MNDYISREAALNFEAEITAAPSEIQAISQGMALYAKHIADIPAADVEPVVHAEWLPFGKRGIYGMMYACSSCHAKYDGKTNYCPNCGAKMGDADV